METRNLVPKVRTPSAIFPFLWEKADDRFLTFGLTVGCQEPPLTQILTKKNPVRLLSEPRKIVPFRLRLRLRFSVHQVSPGGAGPKNQDSKIGLH